MKVQILGCGPAGLMAASTAYEMGHDVAIASEKVPSPVGGAQYLHEPFPGRASAPDGYVTFMKMGDSEGYARKVYGDEAQPTSWQHFADGTVPAWSLRTLYDRLWKEWADEVEDVSMDAKVLPEYLERADLVINTIPKHFLCHQGHSFKAQEIVLLNEGPPALMDNTIIYSGRTQDPWYRTSRIFGEAWTEFAVHTGEPVVRGSTVNGLKPLGNDCDCWPEVVHAGRFGKWEKGVLLHHAMRDVRMAIGTEGAHHEVH